MWNARVAGPVNGEVVASWRKTARNAVSWELRMLVLRPPLLGLLSRIRLSDF
jgi:hypothetical protein